ncbi:MAG: 4-(cytidine 5'-diphospho)-2-C-methyl-D-erythritol kinase [Chloroflexi bacterium]|nr:4-(cytidine 5'-diphospho)-2-C-methyl-D-erythritol kinase [Chloroflexota bacterium]
MILRTLAPAKINLALEVLGRRPDGYHELRSVVQTIDLADTLEVETAATLSLQAPGLELPPEENLAFHAATALKERYRVQAGAALRLVKRIPERAGLGGGSSDAAAVLRVLDRLWDLSLSTAELAETAAAIGSDVPLFLAGPAAFVEGRGDLARPISPLREGAFVLVTPGWDLPNKTRAVYRALRPEEYGTGDVATRLTACLETGRPPSPRACVNNLLTAACRAFPSLSTLLRALRRETGQRFNLAGAGPSVYTLVDSIGRAEAVAALASRVAASATVARSLTELSPIESVA